MLEVAITGGNGVIGSVARQASSDWSVRVLDLPDWDIRDAERVAQGIRGCDVVIHLAWNTKGENFRAGTPDFDNQRMTYNVYSAALGTGVRRVIIASSVHADAFWPPRRSRPSVESPPIPDSTYGASKIYGESLGRYFATRGLEVVCVRFGGVNPEDRPPLEDLAERVVWLSHRDCAELLRLSARAALPASGYTLLVGVSNNDGRVHDLSNVIGWTPRDGAGPRDLEPLRAKG